MLIQLLKSYPASAGLSRDGGTALGSSRTNFNGDNITDPQSLCNSPTLWFLVSINGRIKSGMIGSGRLFPSNTTVFNLIIQNRATNSQTTGATNTILWKMIVNLQALSVNKTHLAVSQATLAINIGHTTIRNTSNNIVAPFADMNRPLFHIHLTLNPRASPSTHVDSHTEVLYRCLIRCEGTQMSCFSLIFGVSLEV
jgi:hypothetical protein